MPELIFIDDLQDPRLEPYRDIRERDLVGRQDRFVAEGRVVLNVLLGASRFQTESILVLETRVEGLSDLIDRVPSSVPVYVVARRIMDAVAGFPMHRGILAIGRRIPAQDLASVLVGDEPPELVVVAAGIANHDNLGAIFRNAAAFEADAVVLDERCCDPLYRKAIRVSVGATLQVPTYRGGQVVDVAAALTRAGYRCFALSPSGAADIATIGPPAGRLALFLGTEGAGLPSEILDRLETLRIDMSGGFDSLNVAAASAIALHKLWRGPRDRAARL